MQRAPLFIAAFAAMVSVVSAVEASAMDAAGREFVDVCINAQESNTPPKALAESAGFAAATDTRKILHPSTPYTVALQKQDSDGLRFVTTTVMPYPASPYSCAVSVFGDPDGGIRTADYITQTISTDEFKYIRKNDSATHQQVRSRKFDKKVGNAVYSVLLIEGVNEKVPEILPALIAIAYCVGCPY